MMLVIVGQTKSLPTRGAWIEISAGTRGSDSCRSLPTRGAWIEIRAIGMLEAKDGEVAPHTGSVD